MIELNPETTTTIDKEFHQLKWRPTSADLPGVPLMPATNNIAAISMFKDEDDVAYINLLWHYYLGIRNFVILDNLSSDDTPYEIQRFAKDYPDAKVHLIQDQEVGYYQSQKLTALAEIAYAIWGVEWIYPFDADEFMYLYRAPLKIVLNSINQHRCLGLPMRTQITTSFDNESEPNVLKRIVYRQKEDQLDAKIIVRWQRGMVIDQGNHGARNSDGSILAHIPAEDFGMFLRHYQLRSKKHIRSKIVNGGKAYEAAPNLPEAAGLHWRIWYREYQQKGEELVNTLYAAESQNPGALYDPLIS